MTEGTGRVICDITITADGYSAGLNQTEERPFGDDDDGTGDKLHAWMFEHVPAVPGGHHVRGHRYVRFEEDVPAVVGDTPVADKPAVGADGWSGRLRAGGAFHRGLGPVGLLPRLRRARWRLPVSVGVG
ncbi:uncharacterized protein SAZU_5816 [Streptomyces azureus]|uniref:Uncharacterized protein n=1 Tax=Streptomyces azureus TaxID=146537 RepID=A0A0K8PT36_STRAJ|nr:uncharacterized protein SAZU_5816 [Streptomyces azureus]